MKILEINKLYSPWIGGIEKVTQDIAEGLKAEGVGVEVLVAQPRGGASENDVRGVRVVRAASWGMALGMPLSLDYFLKFRHEARKSDLIILHHPFPLGFLAYLFFGRKKRMMVWYHSDILRQKVAGFFFRPFLMAGLRRAEKIFVAGRGIVDNSPILRSFRHKCVVIPFGIDLEPFIDVARYEAQVAKIRRAHAGKLILAIGRLVSYKGFSYLIRSLPDLDATLLVVGDGPLRKELEDLAGERGVRDRVIFLGAVPSIHQYYFAADVFVLPSVQATEAFGIVQIEAMAAGLPVINTSLSSAVPEVSLDRETGLTVPPRDVTALHQALKVLLEDEVLRKKYGVAARARAFSEFSMKSFIARFKQHLR